PRSTSTARRRGSGRAATRSIEAVASASASATTRPPSRTSATRSSSSEQPAGVRRAVDPSPPQVRRALDWGSLPAERRVGRTGLARLLVDRVLPVPAAVLLHLDALTVVRLVLD